MNFYEIVLAICMLSDPSQCKEQTLQFESVESLNQCNLDAQFYIASWLNENPEWQMKSFRCQYAQQPEEENVPLQSN